MYFQKGNLSWTEFPITGNVKYLCFCVCQLFTSFILKYIQCTNLFQCQYISDCNVILLSIINNAVRKLCHKNRCSCFEIMTVFSYRYTWVTKITEFCFVFLKSTIRGNVNLTHDVYRYIWNIQPIFSKSILYKSMVPNICLDLLYISFYYRKHESWVHT